MSSEDPSTERAGSSTSLLALIPDRAQLEKERLARVAARERRTNTQKRARSTSPTAPDEVPPRAKASAHAIHPRYIPISPEDRFWKGALKVRILPCLNSGHLQSICSRIQSRLYARASHSACFIHGAMRPRARASHLL